MNTNLKSSNLIPLDNKPKEDFPRADRSLALVKSARNLDRPSPQQKQAISQIYIEQAWLYFKARNWRDAFAACKNSLHLDPHNTDAYKILGNILKIRGKKAEALGVYAKALEINPNSAAIYANLGSFHAEQKNWQQALDYYQQAVIIDPSLAGAYRNLAQVWEELGHTEPALECLCQAVNLEPEMLSAGEYFSFADRLIQQKKLKEASIFLIQGVKLEPQEDKLSQLVKLLEDLEEWQQAVVFYHQLISLSNGESPVANSAANKPIKNLLAGSRSQTKAKAKAGAKVKTAKAIASSSKSAPPQLLPKLKNQSTAKMRPDSATSWNNLGSSYAQKQQWVKAISCYQEAIELDPKLSKTYRNLARVYQKTDKQEQAMLCWYEAFKLKPNSVKPEEHFSLAQRLLKIGQRERAIACLRNAVAHKPNFAQASLMLKKLLGS
ncbi:MAG: tetratricopeptide repeat protein [Cyanobacteria bacterium J06600_6]